MTPSAPRRNSTDGPSTRIASLGSQVHSEVQDGCTVTRLSVSACPDTGLAMDTPDNSNWGATSCQWPLKRPMLTWCPSAPDRVCSSRGRYWSRLGNSQYVKAANAADTSAQAVNSDTASTSRLRLTTRRTWIWDNGDEGFFKNGKPLQWR